MTDPTTFDYTEEDLENPRGRNSLGTRAMFFQRSLYKEVIYPTECEPCSVVAGTLGPDRLLPAPLDTWYDKSLYGKVDTKQNVIIPKSTGLAQITNSVAPNIFVLHPVAMLFDAFVEHMNRAQIMGAIDEAGNSKLYKLSAVKGWENPDIVYQKYQTMTIKAFIKNMSQNQKRKIKNFATFLKEYKLYMREVAKELPITRSNFFLTNRVSPFMGGLSIAIANDPVDADNNKYDNFLTDPNFDFYVCAAKKFGFLVNKNAPWILTADLGSQAFLILWARLDPNLLSGASFTVENFFDFYYDRAYVADMQQLYKQLADSYNFLIQRKPYYNNEKILSYSSTGVLMDRCEGALSIRPPGLRASLPSSPTLPGEQIWQIYPDLLDFYINLKQLESRNAVTRFRSFKIRAHEVYRARATVTLGAPATASPTDVLHPPGAATLEFINDIYKQYIYPVSYKQVVPSKVFLDIKDKPGRMTSVGAAQAIDPVPVFDTSIY